MIEHTKNYGIYHWDTFDNTTFLKGEDDTLGKVFQAHGDATSDNIKGEMIKPHFIRMAETRAIGRAFRWATNNAKVSDVETHTGETEAEEPEELDKE